MLLKKFKKDKSRPREQTLYAITNGTHMGVCIVFIDLEKYPQDGVYEALAMGDIDMDGGMEPISIPEKDVKLGLKNKIIEPIRKLPDDIYTVCKAEYTKRKEIEKND